MKLNVYGRILEPQREKEQWALFTLGEGKKVRDSLVIPADYDLDKAIQFIEDIFHEAATPTSPNIIRLQD